MIKQEYEKMLKETIFFYKSAFCIDGEVEIHTLDKLKDLELTGIIELNDSKKGKFFIISAKSRR